MRDVSVETGGVLMRGSSLIRDDLMGAEFYTESDTVEPYWIHVVVDDPAGVNWLRERSGIDLSTVESMLSSQVRPRLRFDANGMLLILRVADTHDATEHDELRSLRVFSDGHRIVSTSTCPLPVIDFVADAWCERNLDQETLGELFIDLAVNAVTGLEAILEDLDESIDSAETAVVEGRDSTADDDPVLLALSALSLRRCLSPQKSALLKLAGLQVSWLGPSQRGKIQETYERISRQLDEVEVARERVRIIRDQASSIAADLANSRLYVVTVIAAIFVPLGFLTGLLGVNLGGIPGATSPIAFSVFCGGVAGLGAIVYVCLRKWKWL